MTKDTIALINSFGGAVIGAIVGGIASYKGNVKVQQIFFRKKIKLEKLELAKKDLHEYARILNIRDKVVKEHLLEEINNSDFEKKDKDFQEELRIIGRNMMLNEVYIENELYLKFKKIKDDVESNILSYYMIYIDKKVDKSNIVLDEALGFKHTYGILDLINEIDDIIKSKYL